ncbi:sgca-1 [Pristionchus pacificus]|uniref:Sgca-1 n=1 Tax=Pristionchus pacificus TaxID=54126 RepID=A0A2A6D1I6_PRIPA|nr:sgca-1 [Pristionchus pacificus]|eukprot:PDM84238.1 sgca-1 [Pristionchus pacificus]
MWMRSRTVYFLLFSIIQWSCAMETRQSLGMKGKFFVHTLHSATFFSQAVPVEWKATLKGKPLLPVWMSLIKSKHDAIAYLVGTPVGRQRQLTIHVIAKRLDTFKIAEQFVVITLQDDSRFVRSTQESLEIFVRNYNVEDLISDHSGIVGRLENAARETFKGKNVNPYIHSLSPAYDVKKNLQFSRNQHNQKIGTFVSIGTQKRFYSNVHNLIASIKRDKKNCNKKNTETIDRHFSPSFDVDWCKSSLKKITLIRDLADEETEREFKNQKSVDLGIAPEDKIMPNKKTASIVEGGYSFFESVLVFPFIAVLCILLIFCLSYIFFGCREGQQWRDYKTPNDQLEEYASVREGQQKLRDLSVQRQVLLRSEEKDNSMAPSDIHTFLQPKTLPRYPGNSLRSSRNIINKSRSQLNDKVEISPPPIDSIPLGKQTVAEAAKACGSSLHLYRNPLDTESDNDDRDSLDDRVVESA